MCIDNGLFLVCGPCSAESEEQVFTTAKTLKEQVKLDYFRAGIWKPRTRPTSFEGVGESGLPWLKRVQNELHIPVITEVANACHVEKISSFGIGAFWVGARTVANPFSVEEIANAARGGNFTVLVKNPITTDIDLWEGAIERFVKHGIKNIIAVSRGFYPFTKTHLRNLPCWEISIELARRMPEIKIICDPSHIAGDIKYLKQIAQQAINLNFAGLMVETHYKPEIALSDRQQQLTPIELKKLIQNLEIKNKQVANKQYELEIEKLRNKIDVLDYQLIDILKQRFALSDEIGRIKNEENVAILQLDRWKSIVESRCKYANEQSLSQEFIKSIFEKIHKESISKQSKIEKK